MTWWLRLHSASLVAFMLCLVVLPGLAAEVVVVGLLIAVLSLFVSAPKIHRRKGWAWALALFIFGGHLVLDVWRIGVPAGLYAQLALPYWPWLGCLFLFSWWRHPPFEAALWIGAALAASAAGCLSLFLWGGGDGRVRTAINAIPFGNLSLLFGVLALLGVLCSRAGGGWRLLCCTGGVLGLVASLLSGTRGGWVTLPVVAVLLILWRGRAFRRCSMGLPAASRVAIWLSLIVLMWFAWGRFLPRLDDLISDLHRYVLNGNTGTSVGLRLDMWHSAWMLFLQKPWFGWGEQGLVLELQRLIAEGRLNERAAYFGYQLHSDVLDTLARRGLIGLATLLPMYLVPAWVLWPLLRGGNKSQQGIALAGWLVIIMFFGFGLTQSQFRDPYTLSAYLMLVTACLCMSRRSRSGEPEN